MIDLHLHTTASDGWLSPADLVAQAAAVGLTTISVTDHDTVASVAPVTHAARASGLRVIPGIEITSVDRGRDIHLLGYFFDVESPVLLQFLSTQRAAREARVREIGARLAALGLPVDVGAVIRAGAQRPGKSVGRPQVARALVEAGHVRSTQEAFDRLLATGQPAFVVREGPSPAEVVRLVHQTGGIVSLAHPSVTDWDDGIAPLSAEGLDAIEAYHSDHTPDDVRGYLAMAARLGLAVTGGSDFHGGDPAEPGPARRATLGGVCLPPKAFEALEACAERRRGAAWN